MLKYLHKTALGREKSFKINIMNLKMVIGLKIRTLIGSIFLGLNGMIE